jgi:hypothetical protein
MKLSTRSASAAALGGALALAIALFGAPANAATPQPQHPNPDWTVSFQPTSQPTAKTAAPQVAAAAACTGHSYAPTSASSGYFLGTGSSTCTGAGAMSQRITVYVQGIDYYGTAHNISPKNVSTGSWGTITGLSEAACSAASGYFYLDTRVDADYVYNGQTSTSYHISAETIPSDIC